MKLEYFIGGLYRKLAKMYMYCNVHVHVMYWQFIIKMEDFMNMIVLERQNVKHIAYFVHFSMHLSHHL